MIRRPFAVLRNRKNFRISRRLELLAGGQRMPNFFGTSKRVPNLDPMNRRFGKLSRFSELWFGDGTHDIINRSLPMKRLVDRKFSTRWHLHKASHFSGWTLGYSTFDLWQKVVSYGSLPQTITTKGDGIKRLFSSISPMPSRFCTRIMIGNTAKTTKFVE